MLRTGKNSRQATNRRSFAQLIQEQSFEEGREASQPVTQVTETGSEEIESNINRPKKQIVAQHN